MAADAQTDEVLGEFDVPLPTDIQADPETIRAQARLIFAEGLKVAYVRVKDPSTSAQLFTDTMKLLARVGDLEPRQNAQIQPGAGFHISINLPTGAAGVPTIDITPTAVDELPEAPPHIARFPLTTDLLGFQPGVL